MIDDKARAVMSRLEERDAGEREREVSRQERLRQITPDTGRFLHTLLLATRPRSVIEIGTSGGYSTVWIGSAAREVGGAVVTLELDPVKGELARANLADAGLNDTVTLVEGDAFAYPRERREPADFVFLDAEKEDYLAYLEPIARLLREGGLLVADNLTSHPEDLAEFRERALSDPQLSGLVVPIGRGELLAGKIGG